MKDRWLSKNSKTRSISLNIGKHIIISLTIVLISKLITNRFMSCVFSLSLTAFSMVIIQHASPMVRLDQGRHLQ